MNYDAAKLVAVCLISGALSSGCFTQSVSNAGVAPMPEAPAIDKREPEAGAEFSSSKTCSTCHTRIYEQHGASMHAHSYSNEVFRAQFYGEILPAANDNPAMHKEARSCAACHMPIAYLNRGRRLVTEKDIDTKMSGVTCDLCHRIDGYEGRRPGNGNFTAVPGSTKYGPFRHSKPWHHAYLKLQTTSKFCATCHHGVNHQGLLVKPTYVEWKKSPYAKKGIECQDCHMNADGYLVASKATYESGTAADMTLGSAPDRSKLYSHNFPGARTRTQIANAIPVRIKLGIESNATSRTVGITLEVDNVRTGHRMPTGSIELRYLWLDVYVLSGTNKYNLTAVSHDGTRGYDVSCKAPGDREVLGEDFPAGKRIYRAVLHDKNGKQTDSMVAAHKNVFDNRLQPAKVHKEHYSWAPPADLQGNATVIAMLYYSAYPHSFSKRLKLPDAENIVITTSRNLLAIDSQGNISFPMENPGW